MSSSPARAHSLRGLRAFCVAAECRSFRAAGERLHVTPSAISHQVKSLEAELGATLFERLPRAIELTTVGAALFEELQPLIQQIDETTARFRAGEPHGILRISVQPFFASELFVPALSEFSERYPSLELKVDTSDESSSHHPTVADASIRVFRKPPAGVSAERLFSLRFVPASSPEFRDRVQREGDKIIGHFPRIVHESRPHAWREWERAAGIQLPDSPTPVRLDSMIAVARAAERGLGAALIPVSLGRSWFQSGSLVPLFRHELETEDAFYFVCRAPDRERVDIQRLRDWVLDTFGGEKISA